LYQANYVDEDGVYSLQSMTPHPFNNAALRFEYAELGELAYIDRYGERFRQWIQDDPRPFLRKAGHRLLAATVKYVPLSDSQHGPFHAWLSRLVYPIPCLLFIAGALAPGKRRRLLLALGLLATAYLVPYVIAAFYIRYLLPLTPVLCLSVYLALDGLYVAWAQRKQPRQADLRQLAAVSAGEQWSGADVETPAGTSTG